MFPNQSQQRLVDYYGHSVYQDRDGFQGWVDFDENNPTWQTKDGTYIPIDIMEDGHLVECYRMINEKLEHEPDLSAIFGTPDAVKIWKEWEEVLFKVANDRGLVTRLYD